VIVIALRARLPLPTLPSEEKNIATRSPGGCERPGIKSGLLDLSSVSLSELRKLDAAVLGRSIRHAADRTAHIPVTASGSGGAKRVD
jgi:hypothetical protein